MNVRQDEPRTLGLGEPDRFGAGPRDAGDLVTEIFHEVLQVHGDQRLVLDD
jgi:hypothetical protein